MGDGVGGGGDHQKELSDAPQSAVCLETAEASALTPCFKQLTSVGKVLRTHSHQIETLD